MLQCLLRRRSLVLILNQKLSDEILGIIGDVAPDCVLERELTKLDFLHNFLIGCTIEWWNSRHHDVGDDTARPDVALGTVVFGKHFWSNVVRCSELLVELLLIVVDE